MAATEAHERSTDHADLIALRTQGGPVEVMRTWYRTQVFPRHTHDYHTVGVMLHGVGTLWYRGETRTLRRGDVIVIPPGEVHTGGLAPNGGVLSYIALHVPPDVLTMFADGATRGGRAPEFRAAILRDSRIGGELRRLDGMMSSGAEVDADEANDAVHAALDLLVQRHAVSRLAGSLSSKQEPGVVRVARQIIAECYADSDQTSLNALALRAGVTPCHLVRLFTQSMGLSPHRYLIQTRVRHASELLARGVPSSFVAAMTGFVDQSHLTTQFKRHMGTTPASYQRCLAPDSPRRSIAG